MGSYRLVLGACVVLAGCCTPPGASDHGETAMILEIRWQRLVDEEGRTCDRCGGTQQELEQAVGTLRRALAPLGIRVSLEEKALSPEECADAIMESNRIWIADLPLEEWLDAEVGRSPCASCCEQLDETVECRTTTVGGQAYEVIPAALIVKAGLIAAADLVEAPAPGPCCPPSPGPGADSCCS